MNNSSRNYYSVLGVKADATSQEIKAMFYKLAKKYHADANSTDPDLARWSHERMVELNEANETLSDPEKRRIYDLNMNGHNGQSTQFFDEIIFINSVEQGRQILLDLMRSYNLGAPTADLELRAKKEMETLLTKKTRRYLKLGFPNSYPVSNLAFAVERAAEDAVERVQEKIVRENVMGVFLSATVILGVITAIKTSNGFFQGIGEIIILFFAAGLNYHFFYWIARFITRGFQLNLTGPRGLVVNCLIALFLIATYVGGHFF